LGGCRDPRRDVNYNAANLSAAQINLAGMDADAQRNTERSDCVGDCRGAANRARRTVKNADKAVSAVSDFSATKSLDEVPRRIVMPI
jgi:hypothetical protein